MRGLLLFGILLWRIRKRNAAWNGPDLSPTSPHRLRNSWKSTRARANAS